MGSMYPEELTDLQKTQACMRNCYSNWMNDAMNDKNFAEKMGGFLDMAQHDMSQLKARYIRESKMILELTGEEVPT